MNTSTLHVAFTGGGTAGHLFPGLAVAEQLVRQVPCARVTFLGSGKPLEHGSVASAGFDYVTVPCQAMPRHWREWVPALWRNAAGYFAARHWLFHNACDLVVGLGGYASAATARAALDCRLPLVLLEQNAVPGRVTRWLAARATVVCVAFEQARARLPSDCQVLVTGNPIRPGFISPGFISPGFSESGFKTPFALGTDRRFVGGEGSFVTPLVACGRGVGSDGEPITPLSPCGRGAGVRGSDVLLGLLNPGLIDPADANAELGLAHLSQDASETAPRRRLLILGGSSGAQSLNRSVPKALDQIRSRLGRWEIVHQSGQAGLSETRDLYHRLGLDATVAPFVVEMPALLALSDLVICRAGGTTLAELTVAGVPAVLIPYPHASDDHQRENAEVFVRQGAGVMLDERPSPEPLEDRLAGVLVRLLDDGAMRRQMGAAMRRLARPNAAADVAAVICQLALGTGNSASGSGKPQPIAA